MELSKVKEHLQEFFPNLKLLDHADSRTYIHGWVPFNHETLHFLPIFHIIVTLEAEGGVRFRIFTFHGKKLQESFYPTLRDSGDREGILNFLGRLSLCPGLSDGTPHDSDTFTEPLGETFVRRSKTCKYAVETPNSNTGTAFLNYQSCSECSCTDEMSSMLVKKEPASFDKKDSLVLSSTLDFSTADEVDSDDRHDRSFDDTIVYDSEDDAPLSRLKSDSHAMKYKKLEMESDGDEKVMAIGADVIEVEADPVKVEIKSENNVKEENKKKLCGLSNRLANLPASISIHKQLSKLPPSITVKAPMNTKIEWL